MSRAHKAYLLILHTFSPTYLIFLMLRVYLDKMKFISWVSL